MPSLVKGLFGLEGLSDNADFGEVISSPLGLWQAKNWDPAGESISRRKGDHLGRWLINQSDLKDSTTFAML